MQAQPIAKAIASRIACAIGFRGQNIRVWILAEAVWNDNGDWDDTASWIDA